MLLSRLLPLLRAHLSLILVVVLFFASLFFWMETLDTSRYGDRGVDIEGIIMAEGVNFAGEKVPFDGAYYFNREKFEKELSITRFNFYQFQLYHKRAPLYFPTIEAKLRAAGIPDDFKYLAVAESGLRNDALSDKNAGGIWQFVPDTAKRYGLTIDAEIDERYDFEKSTDATIAYLHNSYAIFHDWTLVAASYNRGENGLKRALDDQHAKSYYDLYLNDETERYVFRILAIKYIMLHRDEIYTASELGTPFAPPATRTVSIPAATHLKDWCLKNGYNYASVKDLNPWIIGDTISRAGYTIRVFNW